jgi:5-hydroxyisourate hydrolase-like protein (transthyretin family)
MILSTCLIDGVYGKPAVGVPVRIYGMSRENWTEVYRGTTDGSGRTSSSLDAGGGSVVRLELNLDAYFSTLGVVSRYPMITLVLRITEANASQRVSLLVTPSACVAFEVS